MVPVFKNYINYLKDNRLSDEISLTEGYFWLDRQIVKAFDVDGNIHKIFKIIVNEDLTLNFKYYNNEPFSIESWEMTAIRLSERLNQLENESLEVINKFKELYSGHIPTILTSGGKDSIVTKYLVDKCINNSEVIFNNTTLDCSDTYSYIKNIPNINIITPKEGFYQWRKRLNFIPTRFSRACCTIFKEGAMIENLDRNDKRVFFLGMRREESNTRSNYNFEWDNKKWGDRDWKGILPIIKWSELDVWLYIIKNNIPINSKYKKGYSRVGCAIACPYYTKTTWSLDKYWYPKMFERWREILKEDFINNKKAPIMNCTLKEYYKCWNGGIYRDEPTLEVVEEFAKQQNLDINIANKYFNKICVDCNKKLKKDDIGLSMKLYGRHIEDFKCIKCLSKDFKTTTKDLRNRAKEFKSGGCDLF